MANPISKIRSGIDSGEGFTSKNPRRGLKAPRFARFAGRRVGLLDLKHSRNDIAKHHERLKEIRRVSVAALAEHEAAIKEQYEREGWIPGEKPGHRIDVLGADRRKVMTDHALVAMRKQVVALVETEVGEVLLKLNEAKADLVDARAAWVDPTTVLMRSTLGSVERQTFTANMANAGPVELLDYATEAVREGDHAKGAAVLARMDRLTPEMKKALGFTKNQLAESLNHETFRAAVEHMAIAEYSILLAGHEGREAVGKKLRPADKLKAENHLRTMQDEIGRNIVPEDLGFRPVLDGKVLDASEATIAERKAATARIEKFAEWNAMNHLSPEWKKAGLEGGWLDTSVVGELDKGDQNNAAD